MVDRSDGDPYKVTQTRARHILLRVSERAQAPAVVRRMEGILNAMTAKERAKLDLLMEMLPELVSEGRRILVFSQFTSMLALIENELNEIGIPYALLTGSTDDLPAVVLAASGTDLHLFATQLAAREPGVAVQAVMAEATETGSGVPAALAGRHFAAGTCQGQAVSRGAPISAQTPCEPLEIALRHPDGTLRSADSVSSVSPDCEMNIARFFLPMKEER